MVVSGLWFMKKANFRAHTRTGGSVWLRTPTPMLPSPTVHSSSHSVWVCVSCRQFTAIRIRLRADCSFNILYMLMHLLPIARSGITMGHIVVIYIFGCISSTISCYHLMWLWAIHLSVHGRPVAPWTFRDDALPGQYYILSLEQMSKSTCNWPTWLRVLIMTTSWDSTSTYKLLICLHHCVNYIIIIISHLFVYRHYCIIFIYYYNYAKASWQWYVQLEWLGLYIYICRHNVVEAHCYMNDIKSLLEQAT